MKTSKYCFLFFYLAFFCNLSFSQWSQVGQLPNLGFARISVVDSNVIWATGDLTATPVLYRSVDGGINWSSIPTQGLPFFLTCLVAKDSLTAFVADVGSNNYAGGNAKLFKTTDAGQNWILIDSTGGTLGFFDDIVFSKSNPQFGLALSDPPDGAGNPFYLFITTNEGVDWTLTNPPGVLESFGLLNAAFAIDEQFYGFQLININTNTADSYITSDGGTNWYSGGETMPLFNYGLGEDIVFNDDKLTGIMISIDYLPNIKRTTDGGINWETVNTLSDISGSCNASWVSGTNTVFICADNSTLNKNILRSDDGGLTWLAQNTSPVQNIKEMDNVRYGNTVILYSASSSGEILKSSQMVQLSIPVELTSFTVSSTNGNVVLNWSTVTETNNMIFEIERRNEISDFILIGFVEGKGTTTEEHEYSYIDRNVTTGKYFYRLKQIDFDGTFEYSDEIEVDAAPVSFGLEQNYPNPFNPLTTIRFDLPEKEFVSLKVYDVLGKEVAILMNEEKSAGSHSINFDASKLSSGTYFYNLQAGGKTEVRKMLLLK